MRSFIIVLTSVVFVGMSSLSQAISGESAVKLTLLFSETKERAKKEFNMDKSAGLSPKKFGEFFTKVRTSPQLSAAFKFAKNNNVNVIISNHDTFDITDHKSVWIPHGSSEVEIITFLCGSNPCPAEG